MNDQSRNAVWNQQGTLLRHVLSIAKEPVDGRPSTVDQQPQDLVRSFHGAGPGQTDALYARYRLLYTGLARRLGRGRNEAGMRPEINGLAASPHDQGLRQEEMTTVCRPGVGTNSGFRIQGSQVRIRQRGLRLQSRLE